MENVKVPLLSRITLSSRNGRISVTLAGRSGDPSTILSILLSSYVNCMDGLTLFNVSGKALNLDMTLKHQNMSSTYLNRNIGRMSTGMSFSNSVSKNSM